MVAQSLARLDPDKRSHSTCQAWDSRDDSFGRHLSNPTSVAPHVYVCSGRRNVSGRGAPVASSGVVLARLNRTRRRLTASTTTPFRRRSYGALALMMLPGPKQQLRAPKTRVEVRSPRAGRWSAGRRPHARADRRPEPCTEVSPPGSTPHRVANGHGERDRRPELAR